MNDGKIPLGLCKQACMKLGSFLEDIHEIKEDPDLDPEDREVFEKISDISAIMMANIVNIVSKEMGEEEFLNEEVPMDEISEYPETDILDDPLI